MEKERTHYITSCPWISHGFILRGTDFRDGRILLSNSMCEMKTIRPNFYPCYETESIFLRPILRPRNYSHLPQATVSTSGQIDSISILLKSAGGRAFSCRTRLIVSLRWNHCARSIAKVSNAIDNTPSPIDKGPIVPDNFLDELMVGTYRSRWKTLIDKSVAVF